jgi:hypothetical protein
MLREMSIAGVAAHTAVLAFHSTSHARLQIGAPGWQGPFILVVIVIAPIVAAVLLIRRRLRIGFAVLAAAMIGSLLFGVAFHYLLPGPDNVAEIGHHAWAPVFRASAVFLGVVEAVAAGVALAGLAQVARRPA